MTYIPVSSVDGSGKITDKAIVKRNFANSIESGLKNPKHYSDDDIGDGTTNARTALADADTAGPITLPPGTYAVASNLTLTKCVCFDPGAKLKPASGVTITLSNGYSAEDTQHVFDISAGGTVAITERTYITPEHFGAIADGSTNDFAAIKAMLIAARDSGAVAKAVSDGRVYRIGSRLELDDTYDGLCVDFTGAWIKAINVGWGSNDVLVMLNGQSAYLGTSRDYKHYTINIKSLSIDGDYDFTGFLTDLETAYDANPAMDANQILVEISTAQSANGVLYNGINQYVNPAGTGSATPTFALLADRIAVRNIGKSGIILTNPRLSHIKEIEASNCVVHALTTDLTTLDANVVSGEISVHVDDLSVDSCQTAFDLTTSTVANQTTYAPEKFGTVILTNVNCTNIINRTKIHGPWNLECSVINSGPQHRVCRYPILEVVDGLPERRVSIEQLNGDTAYRGIVGRARWILGSVRLKKVKNYAVIVYGESAYINTLVVDACPFPYRGFCKIDYFRYDNTIPADVAYQCTSSVNYPFYSEGGPTRIDKMEINNPTIGVVSGSQTYSTYAWFFDALSHGSYINSFDISTSIVAWQAATVVVAGEIRSQNVKLWRANSSRTTGASFDATEQTHWTEVGNGTGQSARAIFINDDTSNEFLIRIGSLTGNGYSQYAIQQYSYGTPPAKASVEIGSTNAGASLGIGVHFPRNKPIIVENISQLKLMKGVADGTLAETLGYTSSGDGGAGSFIYKALSRPSPENAFQVYGAESDSWWQAVDRNLAYPKQFGAKADGVTDDRTVLATTDAVNKPIVLDPGTYLVNSNLTITQSLKFLPGAKLKPASGVTITLSNGYSAEDTQHVFDISATGSIVVNNQGYITPQHFGANGTSDADAFKKAVATAIGKCPLHLPPGSIDLTDLSGGISITGDFVLSGSGQQSIITGPGITAPFFEAASTSAAAITISGIHSSTFHRILSLQQNFSNPDYGNILIHDCTADNLGNGIFGSGDGVFFDAESVILRDLVLTNTGKDTAAITVSAIKIHGRNVKAVKVSNVYIDTVGSVSNTREVTGIDIRFSGATDGYQPISVSDCTVKNITTSTSTGSDQVAGILALGGVANISHNMIDTIVAPNHPTSPEAIWTECRHSNINGNTIADVHAPEGAINLKNDGLGTVNSSDHSVVSGNTIFMRNLVSTATRACKAMRIGAENVLVTGNTIRRYHIGIVCGYANCEIIGNNISELGTTNATECYGVLHAQPNDAGTKAIINVVGNILSKLGNVGVTTVSYGCQFNLSGTQQARLFTFDNNICTDFEGTSQTTAVAVFNTSTGPDLRISCRGNIIRGIVNGLWLNAGGIGVASSCDFTDNVFHDVTTTFADSMVVTNFVNARNTLNGVLISEYQDLGSLGSGTQAFNFNNGKGIYKKVTATGNIDLQFNATTAGYYTAIVQQDATGGRTIGYATTVKGTAPTINTTANEKTIIPLFYDGSTWFHV